MRTLLVALTMILITPPCAIAVLVGAFLKVPDEPGSIFWRVPRFWSKAVLWAAGVDVRVHGAEQILTPPASCVYASNHVSWFDVFSIASVLPRYSFVAKAELLRIPIFGVGAKAVGTVPIERANQKAAFASYEQAAQVIREGRSVVVFPEGTRGRSYALRSFKKGPFVLAISAAAPIVPIFVHGTMDVQPKGAWRIRPGKVDLHFLPPVSTKGLEYEDRDRVSALVRTRLAELMEREYGLREPAAEVAEGNPAASLN